MSAHGAPTKASVHSWRSSFLSSRFRPDAVAQRIHIFVSSHKATVLAVACHFLFGNLPCSRPFYECVVTWLKFNNEIRSSLVVLILCATPVWEITPPTRRDPCTDEIQFALLIFSCTLKLLLLFTLFIMWITLA